jgi:hypothetical protein
MDISKYLKIDEMWYGVDRTEGGVGLKIPVRSELVMSKKNVEAQLILNIADDFIKFCTRTRRGLRMLKDAENLEIDLICAENPSIAGVRIVEADTVTKDPYPVKVYLNKTFGINNINVATEMSLDEMQIVNYMRDLHARFGTGDSSKLKIDIRAE